MIGINIFFLKRKGVTAINPRLKIIMLPPAVFWAGVLLTPAIPDDPDQK
jgi:hypothetical protein